MKNRIREQLNAQSPTIATRLWSIDPIVTEVVGKTNRFHYIEFVAEYSAFTQKDIENIARAAELHNMGTMIKVDFQNRGYVAQKAVGSGAQAILFADHRTADEVAESIRYIKPMAPCSDGLYGFPTRRFIGMDYRLSQEEHIQRLQDIVICFMVEKKECIENLDEILSIPGIDMVQFGPSDYSMSIGWNRKEHAEELKEIERAMIQSAIAHGVRPRCEIQSAADAAYYRKLGVKDFSMGDEIRTLEEYWTREGDALNRLLVNK